MTDISVCGTKTKLLLFLFLFGCRHNRQWKLIVSQLSIKAEHRKTLRKLESDEPTVFMTRKCLGENVNLLQIQQLCKDGLPFKYPDVLKVICVILSLGGNSVSEKILLWI